MISQVICIGAATLDAIVVAERPLPTDARIAVDEGGVAGGGPAATAAVALGRQGTAVAFAGRVGDDEAGAMVASGLAREGVDISLLQVTQNALTAFSAVVVDRATASRLILTRSGPLPPVAPTPALNDAVAAAAWVHVDHAGWGALAGLEVGRGGALLSVDGGNPVPGLDLSQVTLYAPSEVGIRAASGLEDLDAAMHWALDGGATLVVVTLGSAGSIAMGTIDLEAPDADAQLRAGGTDAGKRSRIDEPAARQSVVSTLGAGDVFHGLLLAAICDRLSVRDALRSANLGAALSCRGLDGRSAIPARRTLRAALKKSAASSGAPPVDQGGTMSPDSVGSIQDAFRALARTSGTFAMVAIDQRESLRAMLATGDPWAVADTELVQFKQEVARELSSRASAMLVDHPLGLAAIAAVGSLAPTCGLIVAADRLEQEPGGPIRRVTVDHDAAPAAIMAGASALKLLVPWRSDQSADARRALVLEFTAMCREAGLLALVEAVVGDDGLHPGSWLGSEGILAAAAEMAEHDFDLYKAQVPTYGMGTSDEIRDLSQQITALIGRPWVVLSNGVPAERFEAGVAAACRGGASGFLAGRAIWTSALGKDDRAAHLADISARRLERLAAIVDEFGRPWSAAVTATS